MNQFPPSPCESHRGGFEFFENSRRYSLLKVHHRYHWHQWCTLTCECYFKGPGRKCFRKKNLTQKISWHCPFKPQLYHFSSQCIYKRKNDYVRESVSKMNSEYRTKWDPNWLMFNFIFNTFRHPPPPPECWPERLEKNRELTGFREKWVIRVAYKCWTNLSF
jgi:hypothetical protein